LNACGVSRFSLETIEMQNVGHLKLMGRAELGQRKVNVAWMRKIPVNAMEF